MISRVQDVFGPSPFCSFCSQLILLSVSQRGKLCEQATGDEVVEEGEEEEDETNHCMFKSMIAQRNLGRGSGETSKETEELCSGEVRERR